MASGWISLHRKMCENPLWKSEPFTRGQAWVDLLLLANHADCYFFLRGNKVQVSRGEVAVSKANLAIRWQWSKGKVERFIKLLETEQQIEQQKSNLINRLKIVNYESYQNVEQQTGQQTDYRQVSRRGTNNNVNKVNKVNNKDPLYPPWLPMDAWKDYIDHRKATKARLTPLAEKKAIQKLDQLRKDGHDPLEVINQSIMNGWKGLFEIKESKHAKSTDWRQNQLNAIYDAASDYERKKHEAGQGDGDRGASNADEAQEAALAAIGYTSQDF